MTEFTAEIDVDEFIFSPKNYDLKKYIEKKDESFYYDIKMMQQRFSNRICENHKRVIEMTLNFETNSFRNSKNIIKNQYFRPPISSPQAIHRLSII